MHEDRENAEHREASRREVPRRDESREDDRRIPPLDKARDPSPYPSAEVLKAFLDGLPGTIFIKDEQGRPIYLNRFMRESLGIPDDWRQHSTESLFPGEVGKRMRADDHDAMARGYVAREETVCDADGTPHQYYTQKFVFPTESGPPLLGGVALDITGRKQIEEALRAGERKYRLLFENMTAGFALHEMVYDTDGQPYDYRYLEINPAFERLTGFAAADLLGKTVRQVLGGLEPHWLDIFSKVAETGEPVSYHDYVPLLDRYFDTCVFSPDKGFFALVFTDITERTRAEEALKQSETMLRTILDASPMGIACANEEGRIEFWNRRSQELFGYPLDQIGTIEQWYERAYPDPAYRERCVARWNEALTAARRRGVETESIECVVTCHDGSRRDMEVSGTFAGDRLLAMFRDITERKQAEVVLREKSAFLESVIRNMTDGLCVCHEIAAFPFVKFTVWNQRMVEFTGFTMDTINGRGWRTCLFPDPRRRARVTARVSRIRRGDHLSSEEWTVVRSDGESRTLSISTTPLGDAGEGAAVLAMMRDVTEQRRAAEERAKLEAQMQQAQKLESLGVLAGGIAHDFNNLLMSILGFADLILLDLSDLSPHKRSVESICDAARRAADLCSQMLAYSGRGRFEVRRFELTTVVREMSRMLEVSISKRAVLQYDFYKGLPFIEADPTQIRQIIMNLITNASEALGDREGLITISTRACVCGFDTLRGLYLGEGLKEGVYVRLQVSDTGCGMDSDTVRRMFDPFFTTKFTGRGLGLAAVLGIIRAHGGALSVESKPGKGTSFSVYFPAVQADGVLPQSPASIQAEPLGGGLVLLVDDEDAVREVGSLILRKLGFEVLTAADGVEALEVFGQHTNDVVCVVLDLTMPRMDGDECFRRLRDRSPELPVVLCSGFGEQEFAERFVNEPLLGFVQKPYQIKTMVTALRRVLSGTAKE